MDGVVRGEGSKRRLPLWMLGVTTADKIRNCDNVDAKTDDTEEGVALPKLKTRTCRRGKGVALPEKQPSNSNESSTLVNCQIKEGERKLDRNHMSSEVNVEDDLEFEESGVFVRREMKRTKVKSSQHDAGGNDNASEAGFKNQKRAASKALTRKRGKAKRCKLKSGGENEVLSSSEDDEDLTMEDLITIAKEYVLDSKDGEQWQLEDRRQKADCRVPARIDLGGCPGASHSNEVLPLQKETTSCHNSADNSKCDGFVVGHSFTGDPSQDMLDLFLGPLLKKPVADEKNVVMTTNDMAFALEAKKQNQNVVQEGECIPLTKKKSSLKDAVAMFLD